MSLIIERYYPLATGLLAALLWCLLPVRPEIGLNAIVWGLFISGSFAYGFALIRNVVFRTDTPIIMELRNGNYFAELVSYINHALWLNRALCLMCLFGYFMDRSGIEFSLAWITLTGTAFMSVIRLVPILFYVFNER